MKLFKPLYDTDPLDDILQSAEYRLILDITAETELLKLKCKDLNKICPMLNKMPIAVKNAERLIKETKRHNELYHGDDNPEISDAEFDCMKDLCETAIKSIYDNMLGICVEFKNLGKYVDNSKFKLFLLRISLVGTIRKLIDEDWK